MVKLRHPMKERVMAVQQQTEQRIIDLREDNAPARASEPRNHVERRASAPTPPAFSEMLVLDDD
jgi:hypothetical protein